MSTGKSLYSAQTEATIEPFNSDTVTWVHTGKRRIILLSIMMVMYYLEILINSIEDVKSFNANKPLNLSISPAS